MTKMQALRAQLVWMITGFTSRSAWMRGPCHTGGPCKHTACVKSTCYMQSSPAWTFRVRHIQSCPLKRCHCEALDDICLSPLQDARHLISQTPSCWTRACMAQLIWANTCSSSKLLSLVQPKGEPGLFRAGHTRHTSRRQCTQTALNGFRTALPMVHPIWRSHTKV